MKLQEIAARLATKERVTQVTLRISEPVLDVLRQTAKSEGVSVNALCAAVLEEYVTRETE